MEKYVIYGMCIIVFSLKLARYEPKRVGAIGVFSFFYAHARETRREPVDCFMVVRPSIHVYQSVSHGTDFCEM